MARKPKIGDLDPRMDPTARSYSGGMELVEEPMDQSCDLVLGSLPKKVREEISGS
jgi:hypothetical protein